MVQKNQMNIPLPATHLQWLSSVPQYVMNTKVSQGFKFDWPNHSIKQKNEQENIHERHSEQRYFL